MKPQFALVSSLVTLCVVACAGNALPGGSQANSSTPQQSNRTLAADTSTAAPSTSPTPTPKPAPTLPATLNISQGLTYGEAGMFTPTRGDTATGGQSQTIDNIPCTPTMTENEFHVHSYLGLLVNGQWYAIPDSIGFYKPGPLESGYSNYATCFYEVHTHDATGYIHQEAASSTPNSGTMFTLGNLADIWGQTLNTHGFGPFSGAVEVWVARAPSGSLYASNYTPYTGDPNQIQLYSHEAIWLEVGPPYIAPAQLPIVRFYTQY